MSVYRLMIPQVVYAVTLPLTGYVIWGELLLGVLVSPSVKLG